MCYSGLLFCKKIKKLKPFYFLEFILLYIFLYYFSYQYIIFITIKKRVINIYYN